MACGIRLALLVSAASRVDTLCLHGCATAAVKPRAVPTASPRAAALRMAEPRGPMEGLVSDAKSLWSRVVGVPDGDGEQEPMPLAVRGMETEDLDFVPLVLVVGAGGRTGRIIVRKLVLRGFRVAVLVRSLSTETLNLLGSGVSYCYGDMTDYRALLDSMEDVDKVVFAADGVDSTEELAGLTSVMRAFQDTRTFMYGEAEATKLTLFKMRKDKDFEQWEIESSQDEIAMRLAESGLAPKPTVAYWKRSAEGTHRNGVFVGKVFDTYLGSAVVSCGLRGRKTPAERITPSLLAPLPQPEAELLEESEGADGAEAPGGLAGGREMSGPAEGAEGGDAAAAVGLASLDLGEYSGLVLKAIGDGKVYTAVVRTSAYEREGVEYHADFAAAGGGFCTARLPFSNFHAYRDGRRLSAAADVAELDRHDITGLAIGFFPQRNVSAARASQPAESHPWRRPAPSESSSPSPSRSLAGHSLTQPRVTPFPARHAPPPVLPSLLPSPPLAAPRRDAPPSVAMPIPLSSHRRPAPPFRTA